MDFLTEEQRQIFEDVSGDFFSGGIIDNILLGIELLKPYFGGEVDFVHNKKQRDYKYLGTEIKLDCELGILVLRIHVKYRYGYQEDSEFIEAFYNNFKTVEVFDLNR